MLQTSCLSKNRQITRRQLQKFINQNPKLKQLLTKCACEQQSTILHQAVYWNQGNLFFGPEQAFRGRPAKDKLDAELIQLLSKKYQVQVQKIMALIKNNDPRALGQFLTLKAPHQGLIWRQCEGKSTGGMYVVEKVVKRKL